MAGKAGSAAVRVWGPLVRYGQWALVAAFAAAYLTADDEGGANLPQWHVWSGSVVGAIVAIRIVWASSEPRTPGSAVSSTPAPAFRYVVDLSGGNARCCVDHGLVAAAMIFVLLACLSATAITGLIAQGKTGQGSLAGPTHSLVAAARAHDGEGAERDGGETVDDFHAVLADLTVGLVGLHVLGIGVASFQHRENLVASMVCGSKRA